VGGGEHKGDGEEERIWWKYFVFMYENRTITSVEIVLRSGR
jgi:hypothetical protein